MNINAIILTSMDTGFVAGSIIKNATLKVLTKSQPNRASMLVHHRAWIMYGICAIDSDDLHVFEGLAIVSALQDNIDIPKIATTIPSAVSGLW